ncbi:17172_t:CDS:1, partial [Gigaspora rosea]
TKEKKHTQLYVETCARQDPTNNEESDPRPNATITKKSTKNIGRSLLGMILKELDP